LLKAVCMLPWIRGKLNILKKSASADPPFIFKTFSPALKVCC
jgi:hypothetical protein